jgi:hypothetical protein
MPTAIVQKYPRVAQDDTALIRTMETLLGHFDRLAASAVSWLMMEGVGTEPEPEDIDRARELVNGVAKGEGLWKDVTRESIETVALAVASDIARRRCLQTS